MTHKKECLKLLRSSFTYHTKSFAKFHQHWATKSVVIHVRISILRQYQMMLSSVAGLKFIKTKVIFRYHTKGVSNQVLLNLDHKIKNYSC